MQNGGSFRPMPTSLRSQSRKEMSLTGEKYDWQLKVDLKKLNDS